MNIKDIIKKMFIILISIFIFLLFEKNIYANKNIINEKIKYNPIYEDFYFNEDYAKDKFKLLKIFENKNKWKDYKIRACKFFISKNFNIDINDIKNTTLINNICILQAKHFLKLKNPNIKTLLYNKIDEYYYYDLYYKFNKIKIKDNILLQPLNNSKTWYKIDEKVAKKIKMYIINYNYINNNIFKANQIMKKDLDLLFVDYELVNRKLPIVNSWYRSVEEQVWLYKYYQKILGKNQKIVAVPWTSEHNLWTALDFKRDEDNYKFLIENAHNYWFIQSFDNKDCLKYWINVEEWHYRWVWTYIANKWKIWKKQNPNLCNIDFYYYIKKI